MVFFKLGKTFVGIYYRPDPFMNIAYSDATYSYDYTLSISTLDVAMVILMYAIIIFNLIIRKKKTAQYLSYLWDLISSTTNTTKNQTGVRAESKKYWITSAGQGAECAKEKDTLKLKQRHSTQPKRGFINYFRKRTFER